MECARQRYNLGHFYFTGHRCVEKFMIEFRIDGVLSRETNLFAYRSSSATRVI
jgi:hypothetical protein